MDTTPRPKYSVKNGLPNGFQHTQQDAPMSQKTYRVIPAPSMTGMSSSSSAAAAPVVVDRTVYAVADKSSTNGTAPVPSMAVTSSSSAGAPVVVDRRTPAVASMTSKLPTVTASTIYFKTNFVPASSMTGNSSSAAAAPAVMDRRVNAVAPKSSSNGTVPAPATVSSMSTQSGAPVVLKTRNPTITPKPSRNGTATTPETTTITSSDDDEITIVGEKIASGPRKKSSANGILLVPETATSRSSLGGAPVQRRQSAQKLSVVPSREDSDIVILREVKGKAPTTRSPSLPNRPNQQAPVRTAQGPGALLQQGGEATDSSSSSLAKRPHQQSWAPQHPQQLTGKLDLNKSLADALLLTTARTPKQLRTEDTRNMPLLVRAAPADGSSPMVHLGRPEMKLKEYLKNNRQVVENLLLSEQNDRNDGAKQQPVAAPATTSASMKRPNILQKVVNHSNASRSSSSATMSQGGSCEVVTHKIGRDHTVTIVKEKTIEVHQGNSSSSSATGAAPPPSTTISKKEINKAKGPTSSSSCNTTPQNQFHKTTESRSSANGPASAAATTNPGEEHNKVSDPIGSQSSSRATSSSSCNPTRHNQFNKTAETRSSDNGAAPTSSTTTAKIDNNKVTGRKLSQNSSSGTALPSSTVRTLNQKVKNGNSSSTRNSGSSSTSSTANPTDAAQEPLSNEEAMVIFENAIVPADDCFPAGWELYRNELKKIYICGYEYINVPPFDDMYLSFRRGFCELYAWDYKCDLNRTYDLLKFLSTASTDLMERFRRQPGEVLGCAGSHFFIFDYRVKGYDIENDRYEGFIYDNRDKGAPGWYTRRLGNTYLMSVSQTHAQNPGFKRNIAYLLDLQGYFLSPILYQYILEPPKTAEKRKPEQLEATGAKRRKTAEGLPEEADLLQARDKVHHTDHRQEGDHQVQLAPPQQVDDQQVHLGHGHQEDNQQVHEEENAEIKDEVVETTPMKRGRGRPKGRKNKPKTPVPLPATTTTRMTLRTRTPRQPEVKEEEPADEEEGPLTMRLRARPPTTPATESRESQGKASETRRLLRKRTAATTTPAPTSEGEEEEEEEDSHMTFVKKTRFTMRKIAQFVSDTSDTVDYDSDSANDDNQAADACTDPSSWPRDENGLPLISKGPATHKEFADMYCSHNKSAFVFRYQGQKGVYFPKQSSSSDKLHFLQSTKKLDKMESILTADQARKALPVGLPASCPGSYFFLLDKDEFTLESIGMDLFAPWSGGSKNRWSRRKEANGCTTVALMQSNGKFPRLKKKVTFSTFGNTVFSNYILEYVIKPPGEVGKKKAGGEADEEPMQDDDQDEPNDEPMMEEPVPGPNAAGPPFSSKEASDAYWKSERLRLFTDAYNDILHCAQTVKIASNFLRNKGLFDHPETQAFFDETNRSLDAIIPYAWSRRTDFSDAPRPANARVKVEVEEDE